MRFRCCAASRVSIRAYYDERCPADQAVRGGRRRNLSAGGRPVPRYLRLVLRGLGGYGLPAGYYSYRTARRIREALRDGGDRLNLLRHSQRDDRRAVAEGRAPWVSLRC